MTTDVFPFYGTIQQCWGLLASEYERLTIILGREPFVFTTPKHSVIHQYIPQDGDELRIEFYDIDPRKPLITVEAEPVPGDAREFSIFIHAHENTFHEPAKSAIQTWKQIEQTMRARGHLILPDAAPLKPSMPPKPSRNSSLHAWFDWYHAAKVAGFKVSLAQVAQETGYQYGTVRQRHSAYANERGLIGSKKTNKI